MLTLYFIDVDSRSLRWDLTQKRAAAVLKVDSAVDAVNGLKSRNALTGKHHHCFDHGMAAAIPGNQSSLTTTDTSQAEYVVWKPIPHLRKSGMEGPIYKS